MINLIMVTQSLEEKFRDIVSSWIRDVEENIVWITSMIKDAALTIGRASYSSMIIIGVIMWCMNIQKYYARRLIYGGIILALITELLA
jgi:hypothetical protein